MESSKKHVKLEHVISFGDAIFAFSITIVLLSIEVPQLPGNATEADLLKSLWNQLPAFESYSISFAIIGIYWVLYHRVFNRITGSHLLIIGFNLLFLFFITLISLFTMLNITYGSFHIVFILYAVVLVLTGFTLTIVWIIAIKTKSIESDMNPSLVMVFLLYSILPPTIFLISIGISFFRLDVAQYLWIAIIPSRIIMGKLYPIRHRS